MRGLTSDQRSSWNDNGYFIQRGFSDEAEVARLVERVNEIGRSYELTPEKPFEFEGDFVVQSERRSLDAVDPAERVAKIFKLHRPEALFNAVATDRRLLGWLAELVGDDVDCFLSQFIFKRPGALGQPWHQDQWYFRLDPPKQIGVWLACTDATIDNGPLWIVPGSHTEGVHEKVEGDPRPDAPLGYVEIQGADTSAEEPVLMKAGDIMLFHTHLRHRSTDNGSDAMRAAMVYHYSVAELHGGEVQFNHDWMPVLRDGRPV